MLNTPKTPATPCNTHEAPNARLVVRTHVRAGTVAIRPAKTPRFRIRTNVPGVI